MNQSENVEYKLEEPVNFTDPYVLHDVQMKMSTIVQLYKNNDIINQEEEKSDVGNNDKSVPIKTDGILYPIIQINTKTISYEQIVEMIIYYDHFLPTIKLTILDVDELIQRTDIPGYNNTLKVVIVPEIENVYKNIALEFKITSVKTKGEYLIYTGKYKILEFNKKRIKELIYNGCSNQKSKIGTNNMVIDNSIVKCNPNQNVKPNTWEMLHIIANECQLGFSSTDECQNIQDKLPRLVYNKNYEDFIDDQILFSGLDENSVFDAWVDLYGYLVMVNVSWILNNTDVLPNNLGIYAFTGIHGTDLKHEPEQKPVLVPRTLTNFSKSGVINNLAFTTFNIIVDNSDLLYGTSVSMYNFELLDINNGNNAVNQYDVEVIRDSVDDQKTEDYAVQAQEKMIIECNDLPINKQKLIRQKFFSKHRQRILEIELTKLNLGLQRGTLVNIALFENNPRNKQYILSQTSNMFEKQPKEEITKDDLIPDNLNDDKSKKTLEGSEEILNTGLSGMYYIDSMRFEYSSKLNEIKQFLRLIKKSNLNNLSNITTATKVDTNLTNL